MQKFILYNSLSHKKEEFKPIKDKKVGYYTCGPTVYQYAHIGNLRTYIFEDILKRALFLFGYKIKHIMNITDVGHLTSNEDTGEDKIEKEAARQKKTAHEIARFYEKVFKQDLKKLNILFPDLFPRATEHIKEQIALIQKLEKNGFTYRTSDGIYFDTSKFKNYGRLWKALPMEPKKSGRVIGKEKKNEADFALWKFSAPHGINPNKVSFSTNPTSSPQSGSGHLPPKRRQMEWPSPWGIGFPGWHIECSAMSMKYLGEHFDIHAGGIDHIPVHHTNEIAQSEAATGKPFVNYWVHGAFLQIDGKRMGKSEGNFMTLDDIAKKGFDPLDYRYLTLGTHYRAPLLFSFDALSAARNARLRIIMQIQKLLQLPKRTMSKEFRKKFIDAVSDELNIPQALAVFWSSFETLSLQDLYWSDQIFGLNLRTIKKLSPPAHIKNLIKERERYRKNKEWQKADELRKKINAQGWIVEDRSGKSIIIKQL